MNITKHNISSAALAVALAMSTASCNDWLSVQPESQVEDSELFSAESGFKEALAGVYSSMVSTSTYGKELTFGALSIMGQEWDNFPSTTYGDLKEYDYDKTYPTNLIAAIWSGNYNSIANANNLLKHLGATSLAFTGDNYAIIKGEALALRAYLHFDLLRCFGVSWEVDPSKPSIPYCTEFTYHVTPQSTVSEVVEKILEDLDNAQDLLKVDPILTGREVTILDDGGYLINRTMHMNYWAVRALKARVYMWCHRYADAYTEAKAVVDSNNFTWATQAEMSNGHDRSYVNEQVFALNNVNLKKLGDTYFSESSNSTSFSLNSANLMSRFNRETTDVRFLYSFVSGETGDNIDKRYCTKYWQSSSDESWYQNKMPMLRIGEMYLIMAEAADYTGGDGLAILNDLRMVRNVQPIEELEDDFIDYVIAEYRRELLGEGQVFFMFKRLNNDYVSGSSVDMVVNRAYTFPLPQDETEPGNREDNR